MHYAGPSVQCNAQVCHPVYWCAIQFTALVYIAVQIVCYGAIVQNANCMLCSSCIVCYAVEKVCNAVYWRAIQFIAVQTVCNGVQNSAKCV